MKRNALRGIAAAITPAADQVAAIARAPDDPTTRAQDAELETFGAVLAESGAQLAGGEYRPTHNGWKNRETWNASLWINNEQELYDAARELVTAALAKPDVDDEYPDWTPDERRRLKLARAADELRDWYDDVLTDADTGGTELPGPVADAWGYALACVDWHRIAEGLAE